MRSTATTVGADALASQYNDLRKDAYGASMLLAHEQATPGMTLYVEAGVGYVGITRVVYAGGSSPTITNPVSNPRIDLITIDSAGTIAITAGTENASPTAPTYPTNKLVLAEVYLRTTGTTIRDTDQGSGHYIKYDVRPFLGGSYIADTTQVAIGALTGDKMTSLASIPAGAGIVPEANLPSFTPTGTIAAFAGLTIPGSWLLADGSAVSRTTYAALFGVLNTSLGTCTIALPPSTVNVLVVGGGGNAYGGRDWYGGGGGGGVQTNSAYAVSNQAYTVTVGGGDAASSFGTITANAGGAAGGGNHSAGSTGASGGGGSIGVTSGGGAGGSATQGYAGGAGSDYFGGAGGGGGGGGASQAGGNASSGVGGKGGDGVASSISGTSVTYGGGGGGASGSTLGAGGAGGGAAARAGNTPNGNGTDGLGGGGGGSTGATSGGAGGSGVVIIAYPTGSINATGGTITTSGGNTIHTFTTSGTFTVSNPQVTLTAHGLVADDPIYFTTTGSMFTGMAANTRYFAIAPITADTFEFSATKGGSRVALSGTQSGVQTLHRSPYGIGDGSTTFNVPNLKNRVPVGRDAATALINAIGEVTVLSGTGSAPEGIAMNYLIKI